MLLLVETVGGQAGTSSRIENYAGFPEGISGPALTNRMRKQCLKFEVTIVKCCVTDIIAGQVGHLVRTSKMDYRTRSIIVASGAQYRKLPVATPFEGCGVHYACTHTSVRRDCQCDDVVVVGGGNSAGQAAMFLSTKAKHVHLIVRRRSLKETMSAYLYRRIYGTKNITLHNETEIIGITPELGSTRVGNVGLANGTSIDATDIYVMIGATPNTSFVPDYIETNRGFICTDESFRTNVDGIFAVGDVREGSVKRVANASGEGAACVPKVWEYLND